MRFSVVVMALLDALAGAVAAPTLAGGVAARVLLGTMVEAQGAEVEATPTTTLLLTLRLPKVLGNRTANACEKAAGSRYDRSASCTFGGLKGYIILDCRKLIKEQQQHDQYRR